MNTIVRLCLFCLGLILAPLVAMGVTIPTVPVGNAGNAGDTEVMIGDGTTGYGSVAYGYRIGTTEVTNAQYVDFLNAVAATDTYVLYNTTMGLGPQGGITRSGSSGSYVYSVKADAIGQGPGGSDYTYANKPVVFVSWYDSLRFANWLHNGQPTGAQDASTTEDGAYTFDGGTSVGGRNTGAIWFLTSEDEWYKAAYYDGSTYYDYPTGTDTTPDNNLPTSDSGNSANFRITGNYLFPTTDAGSYALSASPYGTFDQGGNVWEWNEALTGDPFRGLRGGGWILGSDTLHASDRDDFVGPGRETGDVGFRVATVPELATLTLLASALLMIVGFRVWALRNVSTCLQRLAARPSTRPFDHPSSRKLPCR